MPSCSRSSLDFLQSHYTVLLPSFLLPFSCPSWWCCSLISISRTLQVRFFLLLSSLLSSHRLIISAMTPLFFFFGQRLSGILLAISVTAVLKVVVIDSIFASYCSWCWEVQTSCLSYLGRFSIHWYLSAFWGQTWVLCVLAILFRQRLNVIISKWWSRSVSVLENFVFL